MMVLLTAHGRRRKVGGYYGGSRYVPSSVMATDGGEGRGLGDEMEVASMMVSLTLCGGYGGCIVAWR